MNEMILEFITLVKGWPMLAQLLSVLIMSGFATVLALNVIGLVGDFVNYTIPTLIRGHAPGCATTQDETEDSEEPKE